MNAMKTTLLFAALIGLFMLIGSYIGGEQGMWGAFIFALILNFVMYWFSDKIVLRMYKARFVTPQEEPVLYQIVTELTTKAGLAMPKVAIVQMPTPNAFATGRNQHHAVVAVSPSIMQLLNENELRAVLAHEIGHVKNHDMLISTLAATLAGAISMLARGLMYFGLGGNNRRNNGNIVGLIAIAILTPIMAMIIQLAVSRSREYGADARGAEYADPLALASALRKLEIASQRMPLAGNSKYEATAHLFIVNPFKLNLMMRLMSTHPPIEERIARLEAMAHQGVGGRV